MVAKDWNGAVGEIANRVQELANMPLPELRRLHPECINQADWRTIRDNRGECIAMIIMEEFEEQANFDLKAE